MTLIPVTDYGNTYILALQLAQSATFQAAVGETGDAAGALTHIIFPMLDLDDDSIVQSDVVPPRGIFAQEMGVENYQYDSPQVYTVEESWWFQLELVVPTTYVDEGLTTNEWAWFQKQYKNICKELRQLGRTGNPQNNQTYLQISEMNRIEGPLRLDQAEMPLVDPSTGQPSVVWTIVFSVTHIGKCL